MACCALLPGTSLVSRPKRPDANPASEVSDHIADLSSTKAICKPSVEGSKLFADLSSTKTRPDKNHKPSVNGQ